MGEFSGIRADISLTTIAEQLRAAIDDLLLTVPHKKRSFPLQRNDRFLFKRKNLVYNGSVSFITIVHKS